jgi:hypothetical protein
VNNHQYKTKSCIYSLYLFIYKPIKWLNCVPHIKSRKTNLPRVHPPLHSSQEMCPWRPWMDETWYYHPSQQQRLFSMWKTQHALRHCHLGWKRDSTGPKLFITLRVICISMSLCYTSLRIICDVNLHWYDYITCSICCLAIAHGGRQMHISQLIIQLESLLVE